MLVKVIDLVTHLEMIFIDLVLIQVLDNIKFLQNLMILWHINIIILKSRSKFDIKTYAKKKKKKKILIESSIIII